VRSVRQGIADASARHPFGYSYFSFPVAKGAKSSCFENWYIGSDVRAWGDELDIHSSAASAAHAHLPART